MRAYYYDNVPGDQRLPHDYVPSRPVSNETLEAINVKHWQIPVEGHEPKINAIAEERDYKNRDTINVSKAAMGDVCSQSFLTGFPQYEWYRFMRPKSRPSSRSA